MAALDNNERVIISGLRTRPDLNDKQACVLSFCEETQRYTVKIDGSGERIKVRQRNVKSASQEEQSVLPSGTQPNGAASSATQPTGVASSPSSGTPATKEGTTTRLSLPAGQWETRVLIQDGSEITVLLCATEHGSISGPTCTRCLLSESTSEEVSAEVEGGELVVFVPAPSVGEAPVLQQAEEAEAPALEEFEVTVEGCNAQEGQADGDSEEERADYKENDNDNISAWEAPLGQTKHRGGTRGAGWLKPGVKAGGQILKQPGRTTKTSRTGVAVSCNPNLFYHRSRRASQARRRTSAITAERRKAAHAKAGAQPLWKAQRHSFSRAVAV